MSVCPSPRRVRSILRPKRHRKFFVVPPVEQISYVILLLLAGLSAAERHGFAAVREGYYVYRLNGGRTGLGRRSRDCAADSDQRERGKQHFGYTSHGGGLLDAGFPRWRGVYA